MYAVEQNPHGAHRTLDGITFLGHSALTSELSGGFELNRNFQRDVFNLRAASGIRFTW